MELAIIKITTFFKQIFSFLKLHWLNIVLFIGFLFALLFAKDKQETISSLLKDREELNKKHREEMDQLQQAVDENIKKRREIEKQYNDLMQRIQSEFDNGTKTIAEQKKKEIKEIIERNHNDPSAAASALNRLFGIRVIEIKEV